MENERIDISKSREKTPCPFGQPDNNDMEKISAFAKGELLPADVFCFNVTLCDNDIDRDGERFTEESLCELVPLMIGRTGICDHDAKAKNQQARLFDCSVVADVSATNRLGQPLQRLVGRAYMLRTSENASTIRSIEGGILSEVSISCGVRHRQCSVCGEDIRVCGHVMGKEYDGKLCYAELVSPCDGYEWSFVAIPAQRNAGVTKAKKLTKADQSDAAVIKSISDGAYILDGHAVYMSSADALRLSDTIKALTLRAAAGDAYITSLREKARRLLLLSEIKQADALTEKLDCAELDKLVRSLEDAVAKRFPLLPQTAAQQNEVCREEHSHDCYKI